MSEAFLSTHQQAARLPDPQRLALEALLSGARQAAAAQAAGVCVRTLQRWLQDQVFVSALHQARSAAWLESSTRLQARACHAVDTLDEVMDCDRPHARVMAARTLLTLTARTFELETVYQRALQVERDLDDYLAGVGPAAPTAAPPAQDLSHNPQSEIRNPQLGTRELPVTLSRPLLEQGLKTRHFATSSVTDSPAGSIPGLSTLLAAFRNRLRQAEGRPA